MAFVCKQTAVFVVQMNNIAWTITMMFEQALSHSSHFILYHIPQLA